jgi:tetratricopeptide (TPR) repeat protein
MMPAVCGILPRTPNDLIADSHIDSALCAVGKPSGNMPDGASKMLAIPNALQYASFRSCIIIIFCCACFVSSAFAQSDAQFARANQAYAQGHFKEAINGYESLVRSGQWSANLFYDLGNAYFRTNDFGRAILNYERALALEQHHPEATANLQIARDEGHALEMQPSWPERYLKFASINQYSITAAAAFWIGVFLLIMLIFARRRSTAAIALLLLTFSIFAGAILAIWRLDHGVRGRALAIVTVENVQARIATADTASSVLALPPGSEIKILSTRGDWIYAALPNNLRGWISAKSAEQVQLQS